MDLDLAYCKIDNLCCMAFNEYNDIADNTEYPDDKELCHGPEDMIEALDTLEKAVNVMKILLKYPDIVNEIGIESDKAKVKWFFATNKDLNI